MDAVGAPTCTTRDREFWDSPGSDRVVDYLDSSRLKRIESLRGYNREVVSHVRIMKQPSFETYKGNGKRPRHQYNSNSNPPRGSKEGYGARGRHRLVQTSYGMHFGALAIRAHFIPTRLLQQVTIGYSCFECDELGNFVRDFHRILVKSVVGGVWYCRGKIQIMLKWFSMFQGGQDVPDDL
ncbi:hypothetical protein H5410_030954, partial [Solanum commersonii]